jgi:hypothetical protein
MFFPTFTYLVPIYYSKIKGKSILGGKGWVFAAGPVPESARRTLKNH